VNILITHHRFHPNLEGLISGFILNGSSVILVCPINSEYSPQFYIVTLIEKNNNLFFESISRSGQLSPPQSVKMYETAYSEYYSAQLPAWYRTKLVNEHIIPYYKKKYYDSLLIKPTGVIDYSKYIK
jgi:hypothetical protein